MPMEPHDADSDDEVWRNPILKRLKDINALTAQLLTADEARREIQTAVDAAQADPKAGKVMVEAAVAKYDAREAAEAQTITQLRTSLEFLRLQARALIRRAEDAEERDRHLTSENALLRIANQALIDGRLPIHTGQVMCPQCLKQSAEVELQCSGCGRRPSAEAVREARARLLEARQAEEEKRRWTWHGGTGEVRPEFAALWLGRRR